MVAGRKTFLFDNDKVAHVFFFHVNIGVTSELLCNRLVCYGAVKFILGQGMSLRSRSQVLLNFQSLTCVLEAYEVCAVLVVTFLQWIGTDSFT